MRLKFDNRFFYWIVASLLLAITPSTALAVGADPTETGTAAIAKIPVGNRPWDVALSPDGQKLYVTNSESDTINIINANTYEVLDTVTVGNSPFHIALNSSGTLAYVTNNLDNSVSVIDLASNSVIDTLPVGNAPFGIAITPDGTRAYVANSEDSSVSVIQLSPTPSVIGTISTSLPVYEIAITPLGDRAILSTIGGGEVLVLDLASGTEIASLGIGGSPFAIRINTSGTKAYISNLGSPQLTELNLTNYQITNYPMTSQSAGLVIAPNGEEIYLSDLFQLRVNVFSLKSLSVSGTSYPLDGRPLSIVMNSEGTRAFVTMYDDQSVSVLAIDESIFTRNIFIGEGLFFFEIAPDDSALYIPHTQESLVSVVDLDNFSKSTYAIPSESSGIAISPDGLLLYLSLQDGTLAKVDRATMQVIDTVTVGSPSYDVALSPDGSKIYVGNFGFVGLNVVDAETFEITNTINTGIDPIGIAVSPDGSRIFVAHGNESNTLTIVDAVSETVAGEILLPGTVLFPEFNSSGESLYLPVYMGAAGKVLVLDSLTSTIDHEMTVGRSPIVMKFGPSGKRGYITDFDYNFVYVLDMESENVIARFSVGFEPIGVLTNSQETELYVTSQEGYLTVISLANARIQNQPKGQYSGEALYSQPVIRIVDAIDGTLVPFNGEVVASIESGAGVLSGTTRVNAVGGIASFPNLQITGTGEFTLKFSPRGAAPITSKAFRLYQPEIKNYRVIYRGTGVDANLPLDPNPLAFGQSFSIATQIPTRAGYTFQSWNSAENGTGKTYLPGDVVTSTSSQLILNPIWKINSYTLNLSSNTKSPTTLEAITRDFGSMIKIPTLDEAKLPAGYQLTSWNTSPDGTGKSYPVDGSFQFGPSDTTLYAQWKINSYKISYDGNGQFTGRVPQQTIQEFGSSVTAIKPLRPLTKRGYSFQGWNTSKDGSGTSYKVGDTFYLGAGNLILYANWSPNTYKVNYRNITSAPVESGEFTTGGSITKSPTPPARAGYIFKGWSATADKSRIVSFPYTPGVARNISLYAVWEKVG